MWPANRSERGNPTDMLKDPTFYVNTGACLLQFANESRCDQSNDSILTEIASGASLTAILCASAVSRGSS